MMIGARMDPVFGPVVLVGDGGKYVEAMPDVQVLLSPFNDSEVKAALARLRIAPLLTGVRGEPALDIDAFCAAVLAICRLMMNPNRGVEPRSQSGAGRPRREGCVALDAVVYATVTSDG